MKNITLITLLVSLILLPLQATSASSSEMADENNLRAPKGITTTLYAFESRRPQNYEDFIAKKFGESVTMNGVLFMPTVKGKVPIVIIAPGSGGVNPTHFDHARILSMQGIATFVVDPFVGRNIDSTHADQTQLSFAETTYDIFAAADFLATKIDVDHKRIGAIGYSRGGNSVLMAASTQLSEAIWGNNKSLKAVMAGWPWCGIQFEQSTTTDTAIRLVLADRDNWTSPVQCQAMYKAMRASNPDVSLRIFKNAHHGFGYQRILQAIPDAIHAHSAPIIYMNNHGQFIDPHSGAILHNLSDADVMKLLSSWIGKGIDAGTQGEQANEFTEDMLKFFTTELKK